MLGARQYERKRPRPECLYQRTPFGGNRGSPIADIGFRRHMNDDGMIGWAALGLINARNGLRVLGVCAQPINRFCRKSDKASGIPADRTRVEKGKRVSARVEFDGRRFIK